MCILSISKIHRLPSVPINIVCDRCISKPTCRCTNMLRTFYTYWRLLSVWLYLRFAICFFLITGENRRAFRNVLLQRPTKPPSNPNISNDNEQLQLFLGDELEDIPTKPTQTEKMIPTVRKIGWNLKMPAWRWQLLNRHHGL